MARGSTLGTMLTMLREECGYASNSSVGQSKNPALRQLLKRTYAMLYDQHDWPHLMGSWEDKTIVAGSRYYDFPTNINMENAVKAFRRWQSKWEPLTYGFDPAVYNQFDSDNDERSDPVQAWRVYSGTQFEVWPLPQTDSSIRFIGKQAMGAFAADGDVCVLDDHLVVLYAAAEELADKPKGEAKKGLAEARLNQLKALQNKTVSFRPGEGSDRPRRPHGSIVVVR